MTRGRGITKEGRRELRWAMVEVARRAVKADPYWKRLFSRLERRMPRNKAFVAIARHLLMLVWYVLTRQEPYAHYSAERIAYKYYTTGWPAKPRSWSCCQSCDRQDRITIFS